jgi:type II secretion system protein I
MKPRASFGNERTTRAFTLVEVMIALVIFFMAVFTVLSLLSNTLRNTRSLQRKTVDGGWVAAETYNWMTSTNRVKEGEESGDFGDAYPEHNWTAVTEEAKTNGLYKVEIVVQRGNGGTVESVMAIYVWTGVSGSLTRGMAQ